MWGCELWLCLVLLSLLTEAVIQPSQQDAASVCGLGPCRCTRGKLLCDCSASKIQEIVLRDFGPDSFSSVSVTNCSRVHIGSRAVSGLAALQRVSLSQISRLTLEEHAFNWSSDNPQQGLLVNITESGVPEVPSYCFQGTLREVLLEAVNISRIHTFAFSAIQHAEILRLHRVTVDRVDPQAFKKCSMDVLSVSESRFGVLPTRTMVDIEVHHEVAFSAVTVDRIKYLGMKIHGAKSFRVVKSSIGHLEYKAFHVHTRGPVFIHNNEFRYVEESAFVGFTVEKRFAHESGKQELVFENNTLAEVESAAMTFNTTGFSPRLDWILVQQKCSCPASSRWVEDLVFFSSSPHESGTSPPHVGTVLYCLQTPQEGITTLSRYQRLHCQTRGSYLPLTLALVSASVAALSVLAAFLYVLHCRKRAKRYTTVPHSPSPLKRAGHVLVVPDGKVYRETELHVIVEQATPIAATEYVPGTILKA